MKTIIYIIVGLLVLSVVVYLVTKDSKKRLGTGKSESVPKLKINKSDRQMDAN